MSVGEPLGPTPLQTDATPPLRPNRSVRHTLLFLLTLCITPSVGGFAYRGEWRCGYLPGCSDLCRRRWDRTVGDGLSLCQVPADVGRRPKVRDERARTAITTHEPPQNRCANPPGHPAAKTRAQNTPVSDLHVGRKGKGGKVWQSHRTDRRKAIDGQGKMGTEQLGFQPSTGATLKKPRSARQSRHQTMQSMTRQTDPDRPGHSTYGGDRPRHKCGTHSRKCLSRNGVLQISNLGHCGWARCAGHPRGWVGWPRRRGRGA